jgi:hypothetical protein
MNVTTLFKNVKEWFSEKLGRLVSDVFYDGKKHERR